MSDTKNLIRIKKKETGSFLKNWHIAGNGAKDALSVSDYVKILEDGSLELSNDRAAVELEYDEEISIDGEGERGLLIEFPGEIIDGSGATLYINGFPCPLGARASMEVIAPQKLHVMIRLESVSSAIIRGIRLTGMEKCPDLTQECSSEAQVLIVVPDYPSSCNLYVSAFAHSRNAGYLAEGLKIQVAAISASAWYQYTYSIDGVDVIAGGYKDLKRLLQREQYRVLVTHFVDENLYAIYDDYVYDRQLIFICHGPETIYRILPKACREYFTAELPDIDISHRFDEQDRYVRRYAQMDNVHWVFVSEWLKETSERLLGGTFKNSSVIYNVINENRFPYRQKREEDRKKILVIRKFDNIAQHSIDQVVYAIRELSGRPCFADLEFEIYGDGKYYDVLTAPLHEYPNVHLRRTFMLNRDIHKLHRDAGILLCPSRHDAHAVAMSEGASSGLVVVGSRVTSNPFFMDEEHNHTLADPEDPVELADIIERLYENPKEYLQISSRLSKRIREMCCLEKTVGAEAALIREKLQIGTRPFLETHQFVRQEDTLLTIAVPVCGADTDPDRCLRSLLNHRNAGKTEILVICRSDAKDALQTAQRYADHTNGIVRVISGQAGGYGPSVVRGIQEAAGRYFRVVRAGDWVDSQTLAELIDCLSDADADLVLTGGSYARISKGRHEPAGRYDMMHSGRKYQFNDLLYEGYGFSEGGVQPFSGNYRLDVLKRTAFSVSENTPYAEKELQALSIKDIETVEYIALDLYRICDREKERSTVPAFWKKQYAEYTSVIKHILTELKSTEDFPPERKRYVYQHILVPMIESQIILAGQAFRWDELGGFLQELHRWPKAEKMAMTRISGKNGQAARALEGYRDHLAYLEALRLAEEQRKAAQAAAAAAKVREEAERRRQEQLGTKIRNTVGLFVPYGLLKWRADRMNNK